MPMATAVSIVAQGPGHSNFAIAVQLAHLGSGERHVARSADLRRLGLLQRRDDLLAGGGAALFSLTGWEAKLVSLCFRAGKVTPAEAAPWLAGRGFPPLLFVPNAGGNRRR